MKLFKCQFCSQIVYFENTRCEKCRHRLGYLADDGNVCALEAHGNKRWRSLASGGGLYRFCYNAEFGVCNWLIAADSLEVFCPACRHNRTIPNISRPANLAVWRKIEAAKHRLFYSLLKLELPLSGVDNRPAERLTFDFPASPTDGGPKILTGHDNGVITIAIDEADEGERETRRTKMHEPYRTLLGHFRHEVGHFYWDRLVRDRGNLGGANAVFGDSTANYGEALNTHYLKGPPADWRLHYVSAYASSHPWEDFAETWAHYLHIVDTLEMAQAFGIHVQPPIDERGELEANIDFDPYKTQDIREILDAWLPLSAALNSLSRTIGQVDLYPFVLSPPAISKLSFVHDLIRGGAPGNVNSARRR